VKKFRKSVNIRLELSKNKSVSFFMAHSVVQTVMHNHSECRYLENAVLW